MGPNWQSFLVLFILIVVLFGGRGRISALMGDMAKGIKSFKKGLADEDDAETAQNKAELTDDSQTQARAGVTTATTDEKAKG